MDVLHIVAIIVAGLMVGSELSVAVFIHPTLNRLPDNVHLPVSSALARVLGKFTPFWYVLVFLLTSAEVYIQWHRSGRLPIWIATSAILWASAILFSITALVPINNRIASWEKVTPPADWKMFRSRWDLLHRWRVVLLTMAFTSLIMDLCDISRRGASLQMVGQFQFKPMHRISSSGPITRPHQFHNTSSKPVRMLRQSRGWLAEIPASRVRKIKATRFTSPVDRRPSSQCPRLDVHLDEGLQVLAAPRSR